MTGIYRRDVGLAELRYEIDTAREAGELLGICFVDVDGLKSVNDEHGHLAGDDMLARVAGVIRHQLPCRSVLMRYGGDEFVFTVPGLDEVSVRALLVAIDTDLRAAHLQYR